MIERTTRENNEEATVFWVRQWRQPGLITMVETGFVIVVETGFRKNELLAPDLSNR
jgi:hypothetical protein